MQSLWARQALTAEGWQSDVQVRIGSDGRIAAVEPDRRPAPDACRVGLLLPALANLHSHAFQHAMAGLGEGRSAGVGDSFWTWRETMYRFVRAVDPDLLEAIAGWLYLRMLESGFASVGEFHYLHHQPDGRPYDNPAEMCQRLAAAASETGIGLTLLPVLYRQGGADGRPLSAAQARFGCDPALYERLHAGAADTLRSLPADAVLGVAPHSLRAVSPDDLHWCAELAVGAPVHMHVAEQLAEVEQVRDSLGAAPLTWLLNEAGLDARWCLVHCTRSSEAELQQLAGTGAVVGLCPGTEANLGDGLFPAETWTLAGGWFGIGTDSNLRPSVFEELRLLEYGQRLRDHRRAVLASVTQGPGRLLWDRAGAGGARALGRGSGRIAVGGWADLLAIGTEAVSLVGLTDDARLDALVFAEEPGLVRDVWSAGRHVVKDGRHRHHERLRERYRSALQRLRASL